MRNEEILPAIIIVVEQVRAPAGKGDSRGAQTRLIRDIAKGAIAIVVKKEIALVGKIGNDNIRAAVIVEIAEVRAHACKRFAVLVIADACQLRYFGERPVSVVVVERVAAVAGHVNILEAVIVIIAYGYAHCVVVLRHSGESGLFRHIRECAVGVLVIEPVPEPAIRLIRQFAIRHGIVDLRAVREEDIEPSIVVIVQEGYSSSHGFQQVLVGSYRAFVLEIDSAGLRDVGELHLGSDCCTHQAAERSVGHDLAARWAASPHDYLSRNLRLLSIPFASWKTQRRLAGKLSHLCLRLEGQPILILSVQVARRKPKCRRQVGAAFWRLFSASEYPCDLMVRLPKARYDSARPR